MSTPRGRVIDLGRLGLAIVPGPRSGRTGMSSVDLQDIEEVEPVRAVETLLAFPGTRVIGGAQAASWQWRAEFESADSLIQLSMALFEPDGHRLLWGGFGLVGLATRRDVASIARHLKSVHRGVWLHAAACIMYAPEDFEREFPA